MCLLVPLTSNQNVRYKESTVGHVFNARYMILITFCDYIDDFIGKFVVILMTVHVCFCIYVHCTLRV